MGYETPVEREQLQLLGRIADALEKISFVMTLNCKPYVVTTKPRSSVEETVVPKPEPEKPPVVKSEAPSVAPEAVQSAPKTNVSLPVESQPVAPPRENLLERYGQKLKQFLNLQVSKIVGWFRTPPPKAIPTGFSISGNAGTAGVGTGIITLSWDHDSGGVFTTQTDAEGNFSFSNRTPGKYTVMPLLVGEYFVPPYREVEVVDSDIEHVDFVDPPIRNNYLGLQIKRP